MNGSAQAISCTNIRTLPDYIIATLFCCTVTLLLISLNNELFHWFTFPVIACGVLMGADVMVGSRDPKGLINPVFIIGCFGIHFFFLAPLLHVFFGYWQQSVAPPPDWRVWLGWTACLNTLGLLVYYFYRSVFAAQIQRYSIKKTWILQNTRFTILMTTFIFLSICLQFWLWNQFGGIAGLITTFSSDIRGNPEAFQGWGIFFLLANNAPILILMLFVSRKMKTGKSLSTPMILLILFSFLIGRILFGGLWGSRSHTVLGLFWAIATIHYCLRPISGKLLAVILALTIVFMYFYSFYKGLGSDFVHAGNLTNLESESGKSMEMLLLGDLGRADTQAYILYRIAADSDYVFRYGATYVSAIFLIIPRSLRPNDLVGKKEAGTNALYGEGSFEPIEFEATNVYGLVGEGLLNFGPFIVPFLFIFPAYVAAIAMSSISLLPYRDARRLLIPFAVILCPMSMAADLDNIVFFLLNTVLIPAFSIYVSSRKLNDASSDNF